MIDKDSLPLDKPRRTPDHPTKSHVVKTRVDGKEKIIRFGEQGASTAGKPKEGESERMKQKRASFKARHAKNIAKGKSSPAYWANKVKWATGGSVDLDENYEGIKKPDFSLLESFKDLVSNLQSRAEESTTQEFDPVRALGRSGAAESLEDLYESYADEKTPHAARAEAGAADPDRAKTAKMVFDSFKAAGFSDAQAKALTAEINREGSLNPAYLYGTHTDASNKATNVGMLSWQGDRANRLMSFMAERGLIDPSGRITPGQEALNAQAEYLRWEMENDPSYARTRETFLANPDIDQETAHEILGKNFIRWRIDDPAYRGSGFDRIYEGYDLLNMAQGYKRGGDVEVDDEDELARAIRLRDLELMAESRNPNAVPAEDPRLLNVGGLEERLAFLNQTLNPVEAIGDAMSAGRDLMAPEAGGYDRLEALGRMLSGVAGVAGPAAVAKRVGAPAATAVMDALVGGSPTSEALADMGRKYAVDETGSLPGAGRGAGVTIADRGDNLFDVLVEGKPAGQLSLAEGPGVFFMDDAMLSPEFRRKGVGSAAYDLIEKRLGERLIPSPRGLSDDAISFWRKRLSTMDPSERATTLEYYEDALGSMGTPQKLIEKYLDRISIPADPAIKRAEDVLSLIKSGRADEVTEEMLDMGDPVLNARMNEHLYRNYDLPMDYESRMARAVEMGFELDPSLHGTPYADIVAMRPSEFGAVGPGVYVTKRPLTAGDYARGYGQMHAKDTFVQDGEVYTVGGNVTPLLVKGKLQPFEDWTNVKMDNLKLDGLHGPTYRADDAASKAATEAGYTGVQARNQNAVIFDPANLRSRSARFDPRLAHLRNLSAGVAAGAIGASQYDPDAIEATAARVRENKFASGGIVRYDPAAVDSVINKLREVNRG